MTDAVLVTGGAGYVGSHTAMRLLERGRRVVVLDDLSTGHPDVITVFERLFGPVQFGFEEADLRNQWAIEGVFSRHEIVGIIDFAAKSLVGESQERPAAYFETNVEAFRNLVTASRGIPIVKSSTAATYGNPAVQDLPLLETYHDSAPAHGRFGQSQLMPSSMSFDGLVRLYQDRVGVDDALALDEGDIRRLKIPTNVYGITKLMDELILAKARDAWGTPYAALRYFNVAGADPSALIGEDHDPETHLIPIALQTLLGLREKVTVFGDDYDTPDGTAIRDYVSVTELADAHVRCVDHLVETRGFETINLGTKSGYSVMEILRAVERVTGRRLSVSIGPRRVGDPSMLVADGTRAGRILGWESRAALEETIENAWRWHRLNPSGYRQLQEERYNPFWGRWINFAARRGSRPWQGQVEEVSQEACADYDPHCYLCPGNTRAGGAVNPSCHGPWSFPNDFPTLTTEAYTIDAAFGPYRSRTSTGVCEVIVYGPRHGQRLSTMDMNGVSQIVDAWAESYARLGQRADVSYVLIFENRGAIMGNSQLHPHGQVYAYGSIPDLMLEGQLRSFETSDFVAEAAAFECEDGRRLVGRTAAWIAFVPFAAAFPYDVTVVPLSSVASLLETGTEERRELAALLKDVLGGLDRLFGAPYPYSLALIQAPTDGKVRRFHMQVHITSLLRGPGLRKHVVGADIYGRTVNPSDPNLAAAEIRRAMQAERH